MKRAIESDPLRELAGVQQRMNRLFETAMARTNFEAEGGWGAWAPVADVMETDSEIVLALEVPGLDQADLDVRVEGDELLVAGELRSDRDEPGEQFLRIERSSGRFARRFPLPADVDRGSVDAKYRTGVLRISLRKRPQEPAAPIRVTVR